jgi:type I restriction enzyme S subunit
MHGEKVDVARANLSLKDVGDFPISLPPLAEQNEIARRVKALFRLTDVVEDHHRKAQEQLDTLPQSILAKAFRGELVPQNPNDEPASDMLDRIREDRLTGLQMISGNR